MVDASERKRYGAVGGAPAATAFKLSPLRPDCGERRGSNDASCAPEPEKPKTVLVRERERESEGKRRADQQLEWDPQFS